MRITLSEKICALALADLCKVLARGEKTWITGISSDSREVMEGDLFLCLKGERTDGAAYIPQALAHGAVAVLTSEEVSPAGGGYWHFAAPSALGVIERLAAARRARFSGRVIGVTGSVGKTTAKEVISAVLGQVPHSEGNYNSTLGMPLSLLSLADAPFWVLELGINHQGEMERMGRVLFPDIGVLCSVGTAHIGELGGKEAILREKTALSHFLSPGGGFLVPYDILSEKRGFLAPSCHLFSFGAKNDADFSAENITYGKYGTRLDFKARDRCITNLEWPLSGTAGVSALLIGCALGVMCGRSDEEIRTGITVAARGIPHRREVKVGERILIDDSYNASPEAVEAALEALRYRAPERVRVAVLGDMLELGEYSAELHCKVGERVVESGISMLFTYGDEALHIANAARAFGMPAHCVVAVRRGARRELLDAMHRLIPEDAAVLFKASRAVCLGRVFEEFGGCHVR